MATAEHNRVQFCQLPAIQCSYLTAAAKLTREKFIELFLMFSKPEESYRDRVEARLLAQTGTKILIEVSDPDNVAEVDAEAIKALEKHRHDSTPAFSSGRLESDLQKIDAMLRAGRWRELAAYREFSAEFGVADNEFLVDDVPDVKSAKEYRFRRIAILLLGGFLDVAARNIDYVKKRRSEDPTYGAFTWEDDMRLRLAEMFLAVERGNLAEAERIRAEYCQRTPGGCTALTSVDRLSEDQFLKTFVRLSKPGTVYPKLMSDALSQEFGAPVVIAATTLKDVDAEVTRLREEQRAAVEARRLAELRAAEEARERERLALAEKERARLAEERRQAELARQKAKEEEQQRKAAAWAAEQQERATLAYQLWFVGSAVWIGILAALKWPGWFYAFFLVGFIIHRHWALRFTLGYAISVWAMLTWLVLLSIEWSGWSFIVPLLLLRPLVVYGDWLSAMAVEDRTGSVERFGEALSVWSADLCLLAYAIALIAVGREVRAAEWLRLRYLGQWLIYQALRLVPQSIPGAQAWAEWRERRRELRDARHRARLAAIEAGPAYAGYGYPGPPPAGGMRMFFGAIGQLASTVKTLAIAGTVLAVVYFLLVHGSGLLEKADNLLTKAQDFHPKILDMLSAFF